MDMSTKRHFRCCLLLAVLAAGIFGAAHFATTWNLGSPSVDPLKLFQHLKLQRDTPSSIRGANGVATSIAAGGGAASVAGAPWLGDTVIPKQLVVLGYHNTGTSCLVRLLQLMGIYAGRPEQIETGRNRHPAAW